MILFESLDPIFPRTSVMTTISFLSCIVQSELCFCLLQLKDLLLLVCISVIYYSTTNHPKTQWLTTMIIISHDSMGG